MTYVHIKALISDFLSSIVIKEYTMNSTNFLLPNTKLVRYSSFKPITSIPFLNFIGIYFIFIKAAYLERTDFYICF